MPPSKRALIMGFITTLLFCPSVSYSNLKDSNPQKANSAIFEVGGTETHGGDILETRISHLQEWLNSPTSLGAIANLQVIWTGISEAHRLKMIPGTTLGPFVQFFTPSDKKYIPDLFSTIDSLKIKIINRVGSKKEEYCASSDYKYHDATAVRFGLGSEICVDAKRLAQISASKIEILALLSHELMHHYGFGELKALDIQRLIVRHFKLFKKLGEQKLEIQKSQTVIIPVPESQPIGEPLTIKFIQFSGPFQKQTIFPFWLKIAIHDIIPSSRTVQVFFWDLSWLHYEIVPSYLNPGKFIRLSWKLEGQPIRGYLVITLGEELITKLPIQNKVGSPPREEQISIYFSAP